jgi:hypothetical protein
MNPEDADETQRAGFRTAQGVFPVAVTDQLALLSAWQVELVDEDVPRIDRVTVAAVVVAFTRIAAPTRIVIKHGRNLLKWRHLDAPAPNTKLWYSLTLNFAI